jgi:hypothetical protein
MLLMIATNLLAAPESDVILDRLRQIKETESSAWRKIPWTASIQEARRISAHEQRPIFLFSMDGNLETGRC